MLKATTPLHSASTNVHRETPSRATVVGIPAQVGIRVSNEVIVARRAWVPVIVHWRFKRSFPTVKAEETVVRTVLMLSLKPIALIWIAGDPLISL